MREHPLGEGAGANHSQADWSVRHSVDTDGDAADEEALEEGVQEDDGRMLMVTAASRTG